MNIDQGFNYVSLQFTFECISIVIQYAAKDDNAQQKVINSLLAELNKLMNKNQNDLTSFLLQIYALMIKNFNTMPDNSKMIIFEGLLVEKNYQQDLVSLFPAYSLFFQELIGKNANLAINYSQPLQNVAKKMLEYRTDNAFFNLYSKIFYALDLNNFIGSGWFGF